MTEDHSNSDHETIIPVSNPDSNRTYFLTDLMIIQTETGLKTMSISRWLTEDPVSFDKFRRAKNVRVNTDVFAILISKLRAFHPQYFAEALGLKTRIKFTGYDYPVQALVPYSNKPVEFYKWWYANQDLINMTLKEKILLFQNVFNAKPAVLKKEHKRIINKK